MPEMICYVTKKSLPASELVSARNIRKSVFYLIQKDHPGFDENCFISVDILNKYRIHFLENLVKEEEGELTTLEKEVIESIQKNEMLSENIEDKMSEQFTTGQRIADKVAEFGGSWTFIMSFFAFILVWMVINLIFLAGKSFDPFPFILLNLVLSCIAAIQAPVIMMSQNRKEAKDRLRSENDYKINLKAELEIRVLHEKLDHLIYTQNEKILQIQQIQMDTMQDIVSTIKNIKN